MNLLIRFGLGIDLRTFLVLNHLCGIFYEFDRASTFQMAITVVVVLVVVSELIFNLLIWAPLIQEFG